MDMKLVIRASNLLRELSESSEFHSIDLYRFISLCRVLQHELRLEDFGYTYVDIEKQTPRKVEKHDKEYSEILLLVADMYINEFRKEQELSG